MRLQPALHRKQQRLSSTCLLPGVGTQAAFLPAVCPSFSCSEQVKTNQRNCWMLQITCTSLQSNVNSNTKNPQKTFNLNVMQQGKVFQIQCHIYSLLIKNPSIRSPVRLSTHIWKPTGEKRWWRTLKTWLSPSLVIRWSVKDPLSFFPF